MQCPWCQHGNLSGQKFCGECGAALTQTPAPAGFTSPESYTPAHLAGRILTSRAALEGERKQVTVLFCDIADSTRLAERLGAEAMHTVLSAFFELALGVVHRYEGTVNQFLGDGFMALFGAPVAHEDHARRAVLAALDLREELTVRRAEGGALPVALSCRMGLNTGSVVVGKIGDNLRMDYTAVGDTTNIAARLQQHAKAGTILTSDTTYRTVRGYVDCESAGRRLLKGKAEPVSIYAVLRRRTPRDVRHAQRIRQIGAPLIGRDAEMQVLAECVQGLSAGHGVIICVTGEAGVGKSRLIAEVRQTVGEERVRWLEGRSLSFGRTLSYWPFLEVVKNCLGLAEGDNDADAWAKLEWHVGALFPLEQVPEVLPYLATFLSLPVRGALKERVKYLDSLAMGHQIFRAARRFFEELARERPLLLLFEDWHWADQSSEALLEHLLPLADTAPIGFCVVSRSLEPTPTHHLREAVLAQALKSRYTEIALTPLSLDESARLIEHLLSGGGLPSRLRDTLLHKVEGNPFFVEEVIRALVDIGALVRDETSGTWRSTPDVERVVIPDTLQSVIMARVDRLEEDVKQVLKTAAVVGRSFLYRLLRAIADVEVELDRAVAELQRLEFILRTPLAPEPVYTFKHALVQQATYESLLADRRRRLHRRVAESIEAMFADRLEEFYGVLADHYARAEDWEKAHAYLLKAGDQAEKIAADAEALAHYRAAMRAYERVFGDRWDPLQRASLERRMGEAQFRLGLHEDALQSIQRALIQLGCPYPITRTGVRLAIVKELLRQTGYRLMPGLVLRRPKADITALAERARLYQVLGWIDYFADPERLSLDGLLMLNTAEQSGLSAELAIATAYQGLFFDIMALFGIAERYHLRAAALAGQLQHPLASGHCSFTRGFHEFYSGHWDLAADHFQKAASAFLLANHLRFWGGPTAMLFHVLYSKGDFRRVLDLGNDLLRVGRDTSDPLVRAWGLHGLGMGSLHAGTPTEATEFLREARRLYEGIPDYLHLADTGGYLGACLLVQGNIPEAIHILEESNRIIAERGVRGHSATRSRVGLAEAYLAAAEHVGGERRVAMLRSASQACRAASRHSKLVRDDGAADALRLQGTYAWLTGDHGKAEKLWTESVTLAEGLGARYVLGLTHLELGKRLNLRSHLNLAATVFADISDKTNLATTRGLLETQA